MFISHSIICNYHSLLTFPLIMVALVDNNSLFQEIMWQWTISFSGICLSFKVSVPAGFEDTSFSKCKVFSHCCVNSISLIITEVKHLFVYILEILDFASLCAHLYPCLFFFGQLAYLPFVNL